MEFVSVIVIFYVLKGFLFHMQYAYIGMPFFFVMLRKYSALSLNFYHIQIGVIVNFNWFMFFHYYVIAQRL